MAIDPAELLDVDVDHLTRMLTFVAAHRLARLQRCDPVEPEPLQDATDGGRGNAQLGSNLLARAALAAKSLHLLDDGLRRWPVQPPRSGAAITQPCQAFTPISTNPLANSPRADADGLRNGLWRLPARDLSDNPLSTNRRQTGILMDVHPVLPWNLKSQQPQLPRSGPDGQPIESSHLARVSAYSISLKMNGESIITFFLTARNPGA
jgi:hypothetical protein